VNNDFNKLVLVNEKGDTKLANMNLPGEIIFENGNKIKYYYDAVGTKWRKEVSGSDTSTTDPN